MSLPYCRSMNLLSHFLATLLFLNYHTLCRSNTDILVSKVAFGSCNRQNKPQNHWDAIGAADPDLFLWTGDSVYAKNKSLAGLESAFESLSDNTLYRTFRANVEVDGTWDDHDMGVNDGGKHVTLRKERQEMFAKYITGLKEMGSQPGIKRDGLYKVMDRRFGANGPLVRFILLDTRSHRDNHYIRSLGEIKLPLTAIIAAFIRLTYTVLGLGREHKGDMLGDDQWQWLESTLKHSTADFHIVVSSVQVLTTNPVVESWGHFPEEKKRLLKLMENLDPPGLVFLSGDVHHGELSRARVVRGSREDVWVEVTSSGLTHTCGDSFINKILCPNMLRTFSKHRLPSSGNQEEEITSTQHQKSDSNATVLRENFYIGKNFGLIADASNETMLSLNISVVGLESNRAELTHIVHSVRTKCPASDSSAKVLEGSTESVSDASTCVSDPILRILTDDFPNYITPEIKKNGGLIAMVIGVALVLITSFFVWAYSGKKPRRKTR